MLIAIDGPAASGKGTLARRLAAHFGLRHLDTGLTYRAAASALMDAGRPLDDETIRTADTAWTAEDLRSALLGSRHDLIFLAGHFSAGQGSLEPEVRLMAYHDLIADQISSTSAFLVGGTPFVTSGAKPARDSYEASLGLHYRLGAVSLGVSYDYLSKADFSSDTVQARVRYDF